MYLQEGDHLAIGQELAMLGSDSELHFSLSKTLGPMLRQGRTTSQQVMAKSKPPIMRRIKFLISDS